jgi:hypothetical protein
MRKTRTAVFAGIAALAVAGTALAANHDRHVMKVDLPDGSVAHVEYGGDVAPKVTVAPTLNFEPVRWFDPFAAAPFAMFDRIAAQMDQQAGMMMRQARALAIPANPANGKLDLTSFGTLPAGTVSYSFVSTGAGTGTCSRSVQVTSFGPGHQPKVISNSAGDCRDAPSAPIATGLGQADHVVTPAIGQGAGDPEGKPLHTT